MDPLDIEEETGTQHSSATTQQLKSPTRVTVEDSMEKIDDLLKEFGDLDNTESQDAAQVTTSPSIPHAIQSNNSSSAIRFSLFPRKVVQAHKTNVNQLSQLKSFFKCILSTNSQTKILPIRTDSKVLHLRTTDQVNELNSIGITNFFKPNKGTKKTLTGDFHINSPLTYEDFEAHPKIASWLGMNGYNIIKCECQASDMVLIGFLSRVQNFAWRADQ
jgi:hypothetical protein